MLEAIGSPRLKIEGHCIAKGGHKEAYLVLVIPRQLRGMLESIGIAKMLQVGKTLLRTPFFATQQDKGLLELALGPGIERHARLYFYRAGVISSRFTDSLATCFENYVEQMACATDTDRPVFTEPGNVFCTFSTQYEAVAAVKNRADATVKATIPRPATRDQFALLVDRFNQELHYDSSKDPSRTAAVVNQAVLNGFEDRTERMQIEASYLGLPHDYAGEQIQGYLQRLLAEHPFHP